MPRTRAVDVIPDTYAGLMPEAAVELYVAAFLARCETLRSADRATIAEAGVRGVLPGTEDPRIQLLVTDDRAHDVLATMLTGARAGMIRVSAPAERSARLVTEQLGWSSNTATAMVSDDLSNLPAPTLPDDLTLQRVQRSAEDAPGVPLADAVAAAMAATSSIKNPPEVFAEYLRSLPPTFRLLAAVDTEGRVRATSGFGVFGRYATVIFVNTDPDWRGRGIGQAMTSHALEAARQAGADYAALDASTAGRSIYLRLGFDDAGTLTRFIA